MITSPALRDHVRGGGGGCTQKTTASHRISAWVRILVQVTIYRRLMIGRDGHLDQS